jgi:hypothetical protein
VVDLEEASDSRRQGHGTGTVWQAENYEQQDDTDILGTDPVGPLAPLEGQKPLLQQSDENLKE